MAGRETTLADRLRISLVVLVVLDERLHVDWRYQLHRMVELDGEFTDMMTRLRMLAVYCNRLNFEQLSNCESTGASRPRSDRTTDRC